MKRHPKKCAECGGGLKPQTITHPQPWGKKLYRFEHVPALVCTQCGHTWLDASVSLEIDTIIQAHRQPDKYEQVPVFSLAHSR